MDINTTLINNIFESNTGIKQGGAIQWKGSKPYIDYTSNIFIGNQALYGINIASFPIRMNLMVYEIDSNVLIFQTNDLNTSLILPHIQSGKQIPYLLMIQLFDIYDNFVNLNLEEEYFFHYFNN